MMRLVVAQPGGGLGNGIAKRKAEEFLSQITQRLNDGSKGTGTPIASL